MKIFLAIASFLLSNSAFAVEAPKIVAGDYLLVYAMIVGCSGDLRAIEAARVDEDGTITLFEEISIQAEERPIHVIRAELLDRLEQRTAHRSKTLELHHVQRADHKNFTMNLLRFKLDLRYPCNELVLPPSDFEPRPFPVSKYERLVYSRNVSAETLSFRGWFRPQAVAAEAAPT